MSTPGANTAIPDSVPPIVPGPSGRGGATGISFVADLQGGGVTLTTVTRRFRRLLEGRHVPLTAAALAFVLASPALRAGLIADDYFHRMILLHRGAWGHDSSPVRELFGFVPTRLAGWMRDVGYVPWWADPAIHIDLGRPLTALTHVLDYALWPDTPALQHLHSLLWFALGVGLVAVLYRKLHGPGAVAGMAALLFAVEDAHVVSAGWIANRNALLCLACGIVLLLLHLEWRRTGATRALLLALAALAVGLGCGEATLGAVAYVAAWQLTCQAGRWQRRLAPLAPYAVVILGWRVLYLWFGYGTRGSALYVDPGTSPLVFTGALVERWPLLVAAQWFQLPANAWIILSRRTQVAASVVAGVLALGVGALLWRLLRREQRARFWALGMAASIVPVCGAFPMDRLLIFAGVGAFGLVAMLLESSGAWPWEPSARTGWRRGAALVLLVLHGPVAAGLTTLGASVLPLLGAPAQMGASQAPRGPEVSGQTFVFVNGNDFPVVYTHIIRTVRGEPAPRRMAHLAPLSASLVRREDARTLVISPEGGFLAHPSDRLLASPTHRFSAGETIERPDFAAEIRSVAADGRPVEVAFRFRQPLEDPQLRWLYWVDGRIREFPLPGVGGSISVNASPFIR
jgi:hypothetical protein